MSVATTITEDAAWNRYVVACAGCGATAYIVRPAMVLAVTETARRFEFRHRRCNTGAQPAVKADPVCGRCFHQRSKHDRRTPAATCDSCLCSGFVESVEVKTA